MASRGVLWRSLSPQEIRYNQNRRHLSLPLPSSLNLTAAAVILPLDKKATAENCLFLIKQRKNMDYLKADQRRVGRWYFGGLAGCCAACFTHPLDLLKVQLQTQQEGKVSLPQLTAKIYKSDGFRGFYSGLTASLMRQLTYTTTRFAVYETAKKQMSSDTNFLQKMALAGVAGAFGGVAGSPADLINVRMQNDIKLPPAERRNYKNAIDGVIRMSREEGVRKLFNGCTMATGRAILMTIGQLSFYDQIKQMLISANLAKDNIYTHLFSSFLAASGATVLTQPMDVLKTRMMNAQPGQFKGILDCCVYTAKLGPTGFFKGFFPAWVRLAPHTILLFVFFEQLRMRFGYLPEEKKKAVESMESAAIASTQPPVIEKTGTAQTQIIVGQAARQRGGRE